MRTPHKGVQHPNFQRLCTLADEHGWTVGLKVAPAAVVTVTLRRAGAEVEDRGLFSRIDTIAGRLIHKLAKGLV